VAQEAEHLAADGRRYLLAHGDAYDPGAHSGGLTVLAGDLAYRALMRLDGLGLKLRRRLGLGDGSLAAWAKRRSLVARRVVERFESALADEARARGFDGIVCGHIHSAAARKIGGVAYVNCGDWVESCSAVVETAGGGLEVLRWRGDAPARPRVRPAVVGVPAWSA
jgi:UDP-2,3-diacylglucosamine pyrophosphatase LpxH